MVKIKDVSGGIMGNLKPDKIFWLLIFCMTLVLQISFLTAEQPELIELLEKDMQYYEQTVKPSGKDAQINFLNRVIQKYEDKGIESMYLIPVQEELKTLQEKPVRGKRLNGYDETDTERTRETREVNKSDGVYGFCKASAGTVFSNSVYKTGFIMGIKLGILGRGVGGSLDVGHINTETEEGGGFDYDPDIGIVYYINKEQSFFQCWW